MYPSGTDTRNNPPGSSVANAAAAIILTCTGWKCSRTCSAKSTSNPSGLPVWLLPPLPSGGAVAATRCVQLSTLKRSSYALSVHIVLFADTSPQTPHASPHPLPMERLRIRCVCISERVLTSFSLGLYA